MGEKTGISWTDSTFNPWIGCTKLSAGCDNCYAAAQNERYHWVENWGHGNPRRLTSETNWHNPLVWANKAIKNGIINRVFCASLADIFDNEVPQEWREKLWALINSCANPEVWDVYGSGLEWLLLTKRVTNIKTMLPNYWIEDPPDWVRLGVTVETPGQEFRIEKLLNAWTGNNFLSIEPMLAPVDISLISEIDWVICGCESGLNARPMNIDWARDLRDQCVAAGVPFFLKQMVVDGKLTKEPYLDGRQWLEFPEEAHHA